MLQQSFELYEECNKFANMHKLQTKRYNNKENVPLNQKNNLVERRSKKTTQAPSSLQSSKFAFTENIIDLTLSSDDESKKSKNLIRRRRKKAPQKSSSRSSKFSFNEDFYDLTLSSDDESSCSSSFEKIVKLMQTPRNFRTHNSRNISDFDNILQPLKTSENKQSKTSKISEENLQIRTKIRKTEEKMRSNDSFESTLKFLLTPPTDDGDTGSNNKESEGKTFEDIINTLLTPAISPINKSKSLAQKPLLNMRISTDKNNEIVKSQEMLQKNVSVCVLTSRFDEHREGEFQAAITKKSQPLLRTSVDRSDRNVKSKKITKQNILLKTSDAQERKTCSNNPTVNPTTSKYDPDNEARFKQELLKVLYPNSKYQETGNSDSVNEINLREQKNGGELSPHMSTEKKVPQKKSRVFTQESQPLFRTLMNKNNGNVVSNKIILPKNTPLYVDQQPHANRPKVNVTTSKSDPDNKETFKQSFSKVPHPNLRSQENNKSNSHNQNNTSVVTMQNIQPPMLVRTPLSPNYQCNSGQNSQSIAKNSKNDDMNSQIRFDHWPKQLVSLLSTSQDSSTSHTSQESRSKDMSTQTSFDESWSVVSIHKNQNATPRSDGIPPFRSSQSKNIVCTCSQQSIRTAVSKRNDDFISSFSRGNCSDIEDNKALDSSFENTEVTLTTQLLPKKNHILYVLSEDVIVLPDGRKLFSNISKIGTDEWLRSALSSLSNDETKITKKEKMIDIVETGNKLGYVDYRTQIKLRRYNNGDTKVYQITKTKRTMNKCDTLDDRLDTDCSSRIGNNNTGNKSKLALSLDEICKNRSLICSDYNIQELDKSKICIKIHCIFAKLYEVFENNKIPNLLYRKLKNIDDCVFENDRVQPGLSLKKSNIRYKNMQSLFCRMLYTMGKIYRLLQSNQKLTKRELFYQIKHVIARQSNLERAIEEVSRLLVLGPWDLNIIAHSGLVYGDIKLFWASGTMTDCNLPATLIPYELDNLVEVQSTASFILVVEKESIFHKLLQENLPNKLAHPFIMITGKGVPDNNTRLFLNRISRIMAVPVFILVDADIYGIRIMLTYRFGSLSNCHLADDLTVPHARWLGVFPSEIKAYGMKHQAMNKRDKSLINGALTYPYIKHHPKIATELECLLTCNMKASIEGLMKSDTFLSESYLPMKFLNQDFI